MDNQCNYNKMPTAVRLLSKHKNFLNAVMQQTTIVTYANQHLPPLTPLTIRSKMGYFQKRKKEEFSKSVSLEKIRFFFFLSVRVEMQLVVQGLCPKEI